MRSVHSRSISFAAIAVVALAASAAAQERTSGLLNSLEVKELVARGEAGDHLRLSAHFTALGNRYTAEAKRHASMSTSFVGNPSRKLSTGMSMHCKRLADLNTQSASTVRELAAYHNKLSRGAVATPPPDGARFQGGAGASEPTEQELNALAAKASTPAEHHALEEYFVTLAKRYTSDTNEHTALAQSYRGTRIAQAAVHHDRLASLSRDAAKQAGAAAAMHKQLATVGR
jgi:hypothetical protein